MLKNKAALYAYIGTLQEVNRDAKRKHGEVFTPFKTIEEMLDTLPESVWSNKSLTWFDPAAGCGNFMIAIYGRLMNGLKDEIPDEEDRHTHIIENMLYMAEINPKNTAECLKVGFKNVHEGDSLQLDVSYDIVVGNPPYNKAFCSDNYAPPFYHEFILKFIDRCKYMLFIVPSRWFMGGKGLKKFRESMLQRTDIEYIKHFHDASLIFGQHVLIKGGVNYFLKNSSYYGPCDYNGKTINFRNTDILIEDKFMPLVKKLTPYPRLIDILHASSYYDIESNDKRLTKTENENSILCYVNQQKGFKNYIDKKYVMKDCSQYKVITTIAANQSFGNIFIGKPNEVHSRTYVSLDMKTESEAESLISYLKTRLPNFMVSLRKNTQNVSHDTLKWVPLPPLDRIWTDEEVYRYYNITDEEKLMMSKG